MAICKQCGTDLNGAKFCPSCGSPAAGASQPQYVDARQRSMAEMKEMQAYFGAKKSLYDNYETVSKEVVERTERGFGGWIAGAVISLLIAFFSGATFFFLIAAAFVALYIVLKKKNSAALTEATAHQKKLFQELTDNYEAYGYCPVGMEYTRPETLAILADIITKGRATTPGDAINLYLNDQHVAEMTRLQTEANELAKENLKANKKAAKNAKRSARYAAADFWLK